MDNELSGQRKEMEIPASDSHYSVIEKKTHSWWTDCSQHGTNREGRG
jgi:hypothetical protein